MTPVRSCGTVGARLSGAALSLAGYRLDGRHRAVHPEDLKKYYQTYYNRRMLSSWWWETSRRKIYSPASKSLRLHPRGNPAESEKDLDPKQIGERRILVKKEASFLPVMGYHVPIFSSPIAMCWNHRRPPLRGKSSGSIKNLVQEKQLVLEADAEHSLLSETRTLLYFCQSAPGKK